MVNIVYKITNNINNKVYIGVHTQKDSSFDGYLGSGLLIRKAILKYGKENFSRRTLKTFYNLDDAYSYEEHIVNTDFVNSSRTYNIKVGGRGQWNHCHTKTIRAKSLKTKLQTYGNVCGQMHTKESNLKRLRTNTIRYGSPNAIIHSPACRRKAEKTRLENLKRKGLKRNHYLNNRKSIEKAKITRIKTTRERSLKKYPELRRLVSLFDPEGRLIRYDILINVSAYLFGKSKGTSCRNKLISVLEGTPFSKRSRWYGFKAYYV